MYLINNKKYHNIVLYTKTIKKLYIRLLIVYKQTCYFIFVAIIR